VPAQSELLRLQLGFHEKVVQKGGVDPIQRKEVARALFQIGTIKSVLGSPGAPESYKEAIKIQQSLVNENPKDDELQENLALIYTSLGEFQVKIGQPEKGYTSLGTGAKIFKAISRPEAVQTVQGMLRKTEYEIKAGYFAYFGQLIQWPNPPFAEARTQFVIGVLGSNPFGRHLQATPTGFAINTEKIKTQKIQGKRIKVVEYKSVNDFQNNYSACHVLFISRSSAPGVQAETIQDRVNAALKKTKGQPVLLVAEATNMGASERLAQSGVMISYWNDRGANHVRMIINRAAEKRERLTISSRLLRLSIVSLL
jgi:hypothetical protein